MWTALRPGVVEEERRQARLLRSSCPEGLRARPWPSRRRPRLLGAVTRRGGAAAAECPAASRRLPTRSQSGGPWRVRARSRRGGPGFAEVVTPQPPTPRTQTESRREGPRVAPAERRGPRSAPERLALRGSRGALRGAGRTGAEVPFFCSGSFRIKGRQLGL